MVYECYTCWETFTSIEAFIEHSKTHIKDAQQSAEMWADIGLFLAILIPLIIIVSIWYFASSKTPKDELTQEIERVEKLQASERASSKIVQGFQFEEGFFITPSKTMIPYDYEFITFLESDGSIVINLMSLGKTERFIVNDPEAVLKEISFRKGGSKPIPEEPALRPTHAPEPPKKVTEKKPRAREFPEECRIGDVEFHKDTFTLPNGDTIEYSEISGMKNIKKKYILLEFETDRDKCKFWTGDYTSLILDELARRSGLVEL